LWLPAGRQWRGSCGKKTQHFRREFVIFSVIVPHEVQGRDVTIDDDEESSTDAADSASAMIGIWGSAILHVIDELGIELAEQLEVMSDAIAIPLLLIGVYGSGRVLASAYRTSNNPRWRARHGLLRRKDYDWRDRR
jgi:hypothetical protein